MTEISITQKLDEILELLKFIKHNSLRDDKAVLKRLFGE